MSERYVLRMPFTLVDDGFHLHQLIMRELDVSSRRARELQTAYDVSEPERRFVRTLLRDKRNVWLYRCHQQRFCGDFIAVDMSHGEPRGRNVVVIELKEREAVRLGREPAGQLKNAFGAVAELVAEGVVTDASPVELMLGGSHEVLAWIESWA